MKRFVIANWKQNMTLTEVHSWMKAFADLVIGTIPSVDVVICPPAPYLSVLTDFANGYDWLHVGAQDVSAFGDGAHTGETGVGQVLGFGKYSIVGHSEREEPRELVAEKVARCLEADITPIACFVESADGKAIYKDGVLVAWEDPENISKNGVYSPKDPADVEKGLNEVAASLSEEAVILYGGSVNRGTIQDIVGFKNLGGVLVGSASLDPTHLFDIITAFN